VAQDSQQASLEEPCPRGAIDMTIWVVLLGCCFLTPIFLALQMARTAHAGFGGYVVSLIVAMVIGASCTALMMWVHNRVVWSSEGCSEGRSVTSQNVILLSAFVAEVVWVGVVAIFGWWATAAVIHHIH
jgi:hypothetical protein